MQLRIGDRIQSDERILGSGEYVAEVLREVEHRDRRKEGLRRRLKPEEVMKRAAAVMKVEVADLRKGRKRREVSEARSLAAKWLVEDLGMTVSDVARMLEKTPAAICYGVRRGREVEASSGIKLSI